MIKIIKTIVFVSLTTIVLYSIENKSNFSSELIIPILAALFTKYVLGDWDKGFVWTSSDLFYWILLIGTSFITIKILQKYF